MNHKINELNPAFILRHINVATARLPLPRFALQSSTVSALKIEAYVNLKYCCLLIKPYSVTFHQKTFIACSWVLTSVCHNPVSWVKFLPHRRNTSTGADTRVLIEGEPIFEGKNSQGTKSSMSHSAPKIVLHQFRFGQWIFSFCSSHWNDQECTDGDYFWRMLKKTQDLQLRVRLPFILLVSF
jgi:hypothetical protein